MGRLHSNLCILYLSMCADPSFSSFSDVADPSRPYRIEVEEEFERRHGSASHDDEASRRLQVPAFRREKIQCLLKLKKRSKRP